MERSMLVGEKRRQPEGVSEVSAGKQGRDGTPMHLESETEQRHGKWGFDRWKGKARLQRTKSRAGSSK